jgi:hypothetical protein
MMVADSSTIHIDINANTATDNKHSDVRIDITLDNVLIDVSKYNVIADTTTTENVFPVHDDQDTVAMDVDGEPKVEGLPDDSCHDTELLEKISTDNNNVTQPKDDYVSEDSIRLEHIYNEKNESAIFQESQPYNTTSIESAQGTTEPSESNTESVEITSEPSESNTETVQGTTEPSESNTESAQGTTEPESADSSV